MVKIKILPRSLTLNDLVMNIFVIGIPKENWIRNPVYPFSNRYPGNLEMKLDAMMKACLLKKLETILDVRVMLLVEWF